MTDRHGNGALGSGSEGRATPSIASNLATAPSLADEARAFLAFEAPWLLPLVKADLAADQLEGALLTEIASQEAAPRTAELPTVALAPEQGSARFAERLTILVRGFFARRRLRQSLTADERRLMYERMVLTRTLDDALKRAFEAREVRWGNHPSPQKGFRSTGQEAIVGAALRLRRPPEHAPGPDYRGDIICPLIRDLGAALMFRPDAEHVALVQAGKLGTPMGGRDLHIGDLEWGILPPAAPLAIATQTGVGLAFAARYRRLQQVCVAFIGDGGASLGEWHEAVNFAAVRRLPMVFVIENNHWALGTHVSDQTGADRFALRGPAYGIPGVTIFGNDADEVAVATSWAAERARSGEGPSIVELVTYRRPGHAHHDDDRFHGNPDIGVDGYEDAAERQRWEEFDPIDLYRRRLLANGVLDEGTDDRIRNRAEDQVAAAMDAAQRAPWPRPDDYRNRVFAPTARPGAPPPSGGKMMAYDEAVRSALNDAMAADERVLVLGEDVGGRYGGAFGVTRGLSKAFGEERCLNTPLAESAIVGCAVGAAVAGLRPVAEMQFADFLAPGFNALVNNAAKLYWRWGHQVPMVVRLPYGAAASSEDKLLGGGPFHSQCPEMWFARTPGWKIVAPASPRDAKGLLLAAIRDPNPVIYLEAKGLYGFFSKNIREEVPPGADWEVPIGEALVRRNGSDLTIVTYGAMVWRSLQAAETLEADHSIATEVIDLRTLAPLDLDTVRESLAKTHRLLVVHEDTRTGGLAGEIAARVFEQSFYDLDAPMRRVTAPDTPIPYSPPLEADFLPVAADVIAAALALVDE